VYTGKATINTEVEGKPERMDFSQAGKWCRTIAATSNSAGAETCQGQSAGVMSKVLAIKKARPG
jgi:hypothetical protein